MHNTSEPFTYIDQLVLGVSHGTFIFASPSAYGWWLSITAVFLILSWSLHNLIAWIKVRPLIGRKTSFFFISTLALIQPYWVMEMYANFTYFNNLGDVYLKIRVFEALCR